MHSVTVPVGMMQPDVWRQHVANACSELPPQFAELVASTELPFVQAVTHNLCPECVFADGQLLLTGDALAGFRPHTAASTGQTARSATLLRKWIEGEIDGDEYGSECVKYAEERQRHGVKLGQRSQFGDHPMADNGTDKRDSEDRKGPGVFDGIQAGKKRVTVAKRCRAR